MLIYVAIGLLGILSLPGHPLPSGKWRGESKGALDGMTSRPSMHVDLLISDSEVAVQQERRSL
jgi:hypothetical protein